MKLKELVEVSERLKKITGISQKIDLLYEFIKKLKGEEGVIAVALLTGKNPYGKCGLGWKSLKDFLLLKPGNESFEIIEIEKFLKELSEIRGVESIKRKTNLIYKIFKKLNQKEKEFFISFILGEVRHGAGKGVIKKAIVKAFDIDEEKLDELILQRGNFLEVVEGIFKEGKDFLKKEKFELFKPFSPMLANIIYSVHELPSEKVAVEYKIDGMRIQVHKKGKKVKIFSRNLKEVTDNLPEIVEIVKNIEGDFVLDGEVALIDRKEKIVPFQDIMSIISTKNRGRFDNLIPFFFDILYKDGEVLFKRTNRDRWTVLKNTVPEKFLVRRIETNDKKTVKGFFEKSILKGNEGIMVKKLNSPYFIGSRRKYWLKLKNFHTLDLVILEAEWGHGRRKGWLSNFLLGCFDRESKKFLPLGKTFKGLTDKEFKEITRILLSKKVKEKEWGIVVKPEIVVETAFSEIEKSPFYESGYALRFARIKRIRYDKNSDEIAEIEDIKRIFEDFRSRKGKYSK